MQPSTIGPFTIERELGRGGMGEVYLARDTRLGRQVAIKALPAHLSSDRDRLARFQREAKVLASLNHSNIGAIYGLEESAGHQYLVLEYVEGETLADRLARGAIPVDEALSMAKQIAEALEAAHEKGVIHRDLKPGNVMVTPDGVVKVLDFGLARTADGTPSTSGAMAALDDSPTITSPARINSPTIPGVILGTAGYMSPEQARGKPVDKRTDIFSFGCVLFEMLTGIGPFPGETVTDSLGAILHREPEWSLLPPTSSSRIRELLERCMAKDRRNRLHDIADARLELERAIAEPREVVHTSGQQRRWWRSAGVLATVSFVALCALASVLILQSLQETTSSERTVLRTGLPLPEGLTLIDSMRAIAVSPDGEQVVLSLVAKDELTPPSLYLRDLSRLEYRPLAGTHGGSYPSWSPDGKALAFFADGKLKRLDLSDGIVRVLCDAPVPRGGSWGTKGTIVFAPSAGGGLMIVSDAGGTPTPITTTTSPGESHRVPQMLPDGERFLYYAGNSPVGDGVFAFDPATKQSRPIILGWTEAIFIEPGMLVFARDENLLAQPFDVQRLELTGTAQPIAAGVYYEKTRAHINAGLSPKGMLIYQLINPLTRSKLAWMDLKGERAILPVEPLAIGWRGVRVSKNGRRAAVELTGDRLESSISVIDLERGIRTRLGDPAVTFAWSPIWGPSEQTIIATEKRGEARTLVSFPLSGGTGTRFFEGESGFELGPSSITPDEKTILFTSRPLSDKLADIMTINLGEGQTAKRFMQTPESELNPLLSPTGDIVAYVVANDEDSSATLKVVAYPMPSAPVQVSATPTGFACFWIDAGELAWVDLSRKMWSATITAKDGQLDVGPPKPMFEGQPLDKQIRILDYDIPRERFLIAVEHEPQEDPSLIVVSDWRPESIGNGSVPK